MNPPGALLKQQCSCMVFLFFNGGLITQLAMQASVLDKLSGCRTPPCCPNDGLVQLTDPVKDLLDYRAG